MHPLDVNRDPVPSEIEAVEGITREAVRPWAFAELLDDNEYSVLLFLAIAERVSDWSREEITEVLEDEDVLRNSRWAPAMLRELANRLEAELKPIQRNLA